MTLLKTLPVRAERASPDSEQGPSVSRILMCPAEASARVMAALRLGRWEGSGMEDGQKPRSSHITEVALLTRAVSFKEEEDHTDQK